MKTLNLEIQKRINEDRIMYVVVDRLPLEKNEQTSMPEMRNVPPNMLEYYSKCDLRVIKKKIKELNGGLNLEESINVFDNYVYIYFLNEDNANKFINLINSLIVLNKIVGI